MDAVARFEPAALDVAARGFKDTTRIAASRSARVEGDLPRQPRRGGGEPARLPLRPRRSRGADRRRRWRRRGGDAGADQGRAGGRQVKFRVRPVAPVVGERRCARRQVDLAPRGPAGSAWRRARPRSRATWKPRTACGPLPRWQLMGADVTRKGPGHYRIAGAGLRGLHGARRHRRLRQLRHHRAPAPRAARGPALLGGADGRCVAASPPDGPRVRAAAPRWAPPSWGARRAADCRWRYGAPTVRRRSRTRHRWRRPR